MIRESHARTSRNRRAGKGDWVFLSHPIGGITMANVDIFRGQGFIGANLNWNVWFGPLGTGFYWDVCFVPNGTNQGLTINSKTLRKAPNGDLQFWVNYTNNSANDTYFSTYLIRVY
jgi:hypothetical protein